MGVNETLRILLTIFLSTACIQNVRLFGVYDVRWPFLAEIHPAPLKRFVPSSVLQAVRALLNAPAALAVFLAGVAPVVKFISHIYRTSTECLKLCPQLLGSIYLSHHTMLGSIYYLIAVCWDHTHIFAHWNKGTLQFWKMPISYQLHVVILVQSSCLMLFVVYLAKWTWFSPLTHWGWVMC